MQRWDIINRLIDKNKYEDYLEIGLYHSWNWNNINCKNKTAVDPDKNIPEPIGGEFYNTTSDEFFNQLDEDKKYDIIFIDGLHEAEQVYRDIHNSLNHLSEGGTIVLHDCNPPLYEHTTTGIDGCWTGDTYKGVIKATILHPVHLYTVDTDWGVGVMRLKKPGLHSSPHGHIPSWEEFDVNRKEFINLITVDEFNEKTK